MARQHHIGSFRPTPLKRVVLFMALSLGIHAALLVSTSIGYLVSGGEAAEEGGDKAAAEADPQGGDASSDAAEAGDGNDDGDGQASSELPERTKGEDATDAYMEATGGDEDPEPGTSLELFE